MPNADVHSQVTVVTATLTAVIGQYQRTGRIEINSVAFGLLSGAFASLPDWIEPAIHPNHRGFFHSWLVLGAVGYGVYQLYHWQPETGLGELARIVLLGVGIAYGCHLLMDARTPKSLPMF